MPVGSRKGHRRPCEVAIPEQVPGGELPNSSGGRAWCLPRFTHCDFGLYTLVCYLHLLSSYVMYQNVIYMDLGHVCCTY